MNAEAWDAVAQPAMGAGPIASIDLATSPSHRRLVLANSGNIYYRNTTSFSDNGTAYSAFATVGSIVMSEPGEPAVNLEKIVITSAKVGTDFTIAVLPNEISGSFTTVPFTAADPWQLVASSTINMKRYDWKGIQSLLANIVKHVQLKITFPGSDTVKNEVYTISLI